MVIAPIDAAPGIPYSGFIIGDIIIFISATTPNSDSKDAKAPAKTAMDKIKKTVFKSKSWAVFMITLNIIPTPMVLPKYQKAPPVISKKTKVSLDIAFLVLLDVMVVLGSITSADFITPPPVMYTIQYNSTIEDRGLQ